MRLAFAARFGYGAWMLSVIIEARDAEEALARTLATLVEGAVEGVLREVIILDGGSADATAEMAEEAGCAVLIGVGFAQAIAQAKGRWLLFLEPGARLAEGWAGAVDAYIGKHGAMPARFAPVRESRPRLFSWRFLSWGSPRPRALSQGLLISRERAVARAKSAGSAEALARGMAVKTLNAEIRPAPM
jgi:glycosyltransferase involved in cell wall biosynthesis